MDDTEATDRMGEGREYIDFMWGKDGLYMLHFFYDHILFSSESNFDQCRKWRIVELFSFFNMFTIKINEIAFERMYKYFFFRTTGL